jgi:chemotaxis protein methyltransferase CheR
MAGTASDSLGDREMRSITALVYRQSGITLHDGKRELVAARLQKRLRHHGFSTYSQYLKYLEADATGDELVALLDAIATNHTSFFREPQHFQFLCDRVLPELAPRAGASGLAGWSAACSTGEEPYTIAMALIDHGVDRFQLFASDISTKALATARSAVYRLESVHRLPQAVLKRHFERGMGQQQGLARVAPHVRNRVEFARLNLIEIGHLQRQFEFIFCRNVMIYFDRDVRQRVVSMLERHLAPGGYLFVSHSESLNGVTHRLQWVAPATYRRSTT